MLFIDLRLRPEKLCRFQQRFPTSQRGEILQADVAGVAEFFDHPQQEGIIGFARGGLVPPRNSGDVEVPDVVDVVAQKLGEIAAPDRHVVDVIQHIDVGASRFLDDGANRSDLRRFRTAK